MTDQQKHKIRLLLEALARNAYRSAKVGSALHERDYADRFLEWIVDIVEEKPPDLGVHIEEIITTEDVFGGS